MNRTMEKEVNLIELFYDILSHWKLYIIVAILGAMLLSCFSYVKEMKEYNKAINAVPEKVELTSNESGYVDEVVLMHTAFLEYQDALYTGYFSKIDSNNVYQLSAVYNVGTSANALKIKSYLASSEVYRNVAKVLGKISVLDVKYLFSSVENKENLSVIIKAANEEDADKVEKCVLELVKSYSSTLGANAEAVTKVSENRVWIEDAQFVKDKSACMANAMNQKKQIEDCIKLMSVEQLAYFEEKTEIQIKNYYSVDLTALNYQEESVIIKPTIRKKKILIGGIVSIFVVLFFNVVMFVGSNKLVSRDEVEKLYNVKLLCNAKMSKEKKLAVDRFIERKKYFIDKNEPTVINAYVIESIKNELLKNGVKKVGLCSSSIEITELVNAELKELGVSIIQNDMYSIEGIQEMKECDAFVLVEKYNKTPKMRLQKLIEIIEQNDKKIIGIIMEY